MERSTASPDNRRSGVILRRTYGKYMIPTILSAVGVSLSEFADSLIVGQLLNENAFAIVNLGTPIVFLACMIYTITGLGGSLLYAEHLGRKEEEKADEIFTISVCRWRPAFCCFWASGSFRRGWGRCLAARSPCWPILNVT